jgi:hypothetical protein
VLLLPEVFQVICWFKNLAGGPIIIQVTSSSLQSAGSSINALLNDDTILRRLSTASSRYTVQLYKLETYMGLYIIEFVFVLLHSLLLDLLYAYEL